MWTDSLHSGPDSTVPAESHLSLFYPSHTEKIMDNSQCVHRQGGEKVNGLIKIKGSILQEERIHTDLQPLSS